MELVDEFEARYPEECSEYETAGKEILRITEEFAGFEINGVGLDNVHAQGYMDAIWVTLRQHGDGTISLAGNEIFNLTTQAEFTHKRLCLSK